MLRSIGNIWLGPLWVVAFTIGPAFAHGQLIGPRGMPGGFNSTAFGTNVGSFGNAGGFGTGPGLANGFSNSANFGSNRAGVYSRVPGLANSGYALGIQSGFGGGFYGNPGVGVGGFYNNGSPFGMAGGFYPPNVAADLLGAQLGMNAYGGGFVDPTTAATLSALGAGGFAYPGMMPGMLPGAAMIPGAMMPGGLMPGAMDLGAMNVGIDGGMDFGANLGTNRPPVRPRAQSSSDSTSSSGANAESARGRPRHSLLPEVSRTKFDDGVPRPTLTAVRIQNRLNNCRTPDFTNIKVLMNGATAILTGNVASESDAQLAVRMVGLEPGVLKVTSELKHP